MVDGPHDGPYDGPGTAPAHAPPHGVHATHRALAARTAEEVLAGYLHRQSSDFLRSLRLHRESGSDAEGAGEAARRLRRAARRISATLHTFRPLTEETWADQLLAELGWLSGTLGREQTCAARRERLMAALTRLTGRGERADRPDRGTRDAGAARTAPNQADRGSTASAPGDPDGAGGEHGVGVR
ncbi:CHAD domain-containing protein, partial [Streptomyces lydicus]|uniref:CHAD domain-containing protein n=1 Tax=Streptomyces lydicus TaxID=47763 RepID=UPI003D9E68C2